MSPQDGTLAIGWSAPGRVASFPLPALAADADGRPQVAGVPGLRADGIGRGRIRLRHLPTGGVLELLDPPASTSLLTAQLDAELAARQDMTGSLEPEHYRLIPETFATYLDYRSWFNRLSSTHRLEPRHLDQALAAYGRFLASGWGVPFR